MRTRSLTWVALAALALLVRLVVLWEIRDAPFVGSALGDARAYDAWAAQIVAGRGDEVGVFYQAPLYPYLLAGVYAVVGRDLGAVRLLQALLGSAACVLLGVAGCRLLGRRVGVLAAALLAIWPSAVFADLLIQKSSLDTFLLCALLAALAPALAAGRAPWWLACGLLVGALGLARENALVFVPVLAVAAVWRERRQRARAAAAALALLAGVVLALLPVAVRNYRLSGEIHVTTAQFGPNFFIGNHAGASGVYQALRYGRGDAEYERADATALAEQAVGRALRPGEVSSYWTGRALAFIAAEPLAWLRLLGRKAVLLVNRVEVGDVEDLYTYGDWSMLLRLLTRLLDYGTLVPLAVAGLIFCALRPASPPAPTQRFAAGVLAAMLLAYGLGVVATYVMARYRHPALPLLLLFAAAGVVEGVRLAHARRWRRLAPALAAAALAALPANWPLIGEAGVRAGSLYNIGRDLEDRGGGQPQAIAFYRAALALDPTHALAHNNLAVALRRGGHLEEALEHFRRAVALGPSHADFHYNLGGALAAAGDAAGAEAAYERALKLQPNDADTHNNLGVLRQQQGDLRAAARSFERALALDPRKAEAMNNLGVAYATLGELDLAARWFRAAAEADPESESARDNLARVLAEIGAR